MRRLLTLLVFALAYSLFTALVGYSLFLLTNGPTSTLFVFIFLAATIAVLLYPGNEIKRK